MTKYLFLHEDDASERKIYLVNANSIEEAYFKFAKEIGIKDEVFLEHISQRSVNMSFAEKFWLQTEEEDSIFNNTGNIIINENEFRKRVNIYFEEKSEFSNEYLNYYFSSYESSCLSTELLIYLWLKEWKSYIGVDTEEIYLIN